MISLSAILAWLGSYAGGLAVKLVVDLVSEWWAQRQAQANQIEIGRQQERQEAAAASDAENAAADEAVADARASQAAHPNSDDGRDTQFRRD